MNWPIGMGKGLEGLYDIHHNRIEFYRPETIMMSALLPWMKKDCCQKAIL